MKESDYWFPTFDVLRKNRMREACLKYGPCTDENLLKRNTMRGMYERLKKYEETGNTEWLVDAANFLMLEWKCPQHPEAHFRATNSDESPGLFNTSDRQFDVKHSDKIGGEI